MAFVDSTEETGVTRSKIAEPSLYNTFTTSNLNVCFLFLLEVFKVSTPLPQNGDLEYKPDTNVFSEISYSIASTQTPPEFNLPEDDLQPGMLTSVMYLKLTSASI